MPPLHLDLIMEKVIQWLLGPGLRSLVIAIGAYVLIRMAKSAIKRIERLSDDHDDTHLSELEKRAQTLGNLLSKVATVVIGIIALIAILDQFGLNVTPIITAAGIGGVAVGFGAQNLVRDFLSGFFMLMENQIRLGDFVSLNGKSGVVEGMTLRTTIIRDLDGSVHIFPNGIITSLTNMTKDWSRYVIEVSVAYREDPDRVMTVLQEVGDQMAEEQNYRPWITGRVQVLGVDDFAPEGMKFKVLITTKPQKQWEIGREMRRRIKKRFDAEGIEIPFPQTTLTWGGGQPLQVDWVGGKDSSPQGPESPRD